MAFASIALLLSVILTIVVWEISLQSIIPEDAEAEEALAGVFAIIILALPLVFGTIISGVLSAIFAPLSFTLLRKSSVKALSIIGIVYGSIFSLLFVADVVRFILFITSVY